MIGHNSVWKILARLSLVLPLLTMISPSLAFAEGQAGAVLVYGSSIPDIGAKREGLPALAALVESARAEGEVFFLFGGASLGPSMLGSLDKGAHLIDILNSMAPDALGISKREFIFGEDELAMRSREAFFPFVLSNAQDTRSNGPIEGIEEGFVVEKGGVKLGVLALIGDDVLTAYPPKYVKLQDKSERVTTLAGGLREEGAQLVVLLADFVWDLAEEFLEQGIVDIIITNEAKSNSIVPTSRGLYIHTNNNGTTGVKIDLAAVDAHFFNLGDIPGDESIRQMVSNYLDHLEKILNVEVGVVGAGFDTLRANVRTRENAFGNFIADAMRNSLNSDLALINGGVIRGNKSYEAGNIFYLRDLRGEIPFHDELFLLRVTGRQLWAALESGLSQTETLAGRFPQISGMKVTYKPNNAVGGRLVSVEVGGHPLDLDKKYTLATSLYLSDGGDGYSMFAEAERLPTQSVMLVDIVRLAITDSGTFSPVLDNRLLALP